MTHCLRQHHRDPKTTKTANKTFVVVVTFVNAINAMIHQLQLRFVNVVITISYAMPVDRRYHSQHSQDWDLFSVSPVFDAGRVLEMRVARNCAVSVPDSAMVLGFAEPLTLAEAHWTANYAQTCRFLGRASDEIQDWWWDSLTCAGVAAGSPRSIMDFLADAAMVFDREELVRWFQSCCLVPPFTWPTYHFCPVVGDLAAAASVYYLSLELQGPPHADPRVPSRRLQLQHQGSADAAAKAAPPAAAMEAAPLAEAAPPVEAALPAEAAPPAEAAAAAEAFFIDGGENDPRKIPSSRLKTPCDVCHRIFSTRYNMNVVSLAARPFALTSLHRTTHRVF